MVKRKDLIRKYIEFFKSYNHKEIPSSSLVPENDPTVLFTTAGMHPLVPFLMGEKHPLGKRLTSVQKCIRTGDIDEVGDNCHHTFFEMLGNWSLGDYFKKESIEMSFKFLTEELKIPINHLAVSVFKGNEFSEKDLVSFEMWKSLGIPEERIAFTEKDNWWGPAGKTGPCGPDTEIFFWNSKEKVPEKFNPEDKRWVEIWNNVFMEFDKTSEGNFDILKNKNVDTGLGVERVLAVMNKTDDNYLTEIWQPIIKEIEKISGKKYSENKRTMRIIADHIKASVFIISDGVVPSNTERGYVLRRLIRRAIVNMKKLGIENEKGLINSAKKIFEIYDDYENLTDNKDKILEEIKKEEINFRKTLERGLKEFEKMSLKDISGKNAFLLFQSYGFPIEMTSELAKEKNVNVDLEEFEKELKKHQELSRTASAGMFKSGLADNTEQTKKLHTATHLLNKALKFILNDENIKQKGSNINPERLRFDFNFDRKLTKEELKKIEEWVNKIVEKDLVVEKDEMNLDDAIKSGAEGEFGKKYPEKVFVYTIKDGEEIISKEICTGPHVSRTSELGNFRIIKEESSSAGVRRIKAVLE